MTGRDAVVRPSELRGGTMSTINHASTSGVAGPRSNGPRATEAERSSAASLLRLIWGIHISRCVYAVAELGIADLLADGPVSTKQLARRTGSDEPSLYRVLRLLAALDVFQEHDGGSFSLTAIGERLRSDATRGMRSWATFLEAIGGIRPFEHILQTVKTGTPGLECEFGTGVFEFLAQHPESAATFDRAMSERTAAYAPSVAQNYDFSDVRGVVDVGGGNGTLLVEILRMHPTCTECCSRSRPWPLAPTRCWTRSRSALAARSWPGTSSNKFRTAPTATCSRTYCTTGTTRDRSRSCETAAGRWQAAAGS